jgi:hypothetical protein
MTWRTNLVFSLFIQFFSLLGRHGGDYGTKDIQVLHYGIWPWRRILNRACISSSNLPENVAWQTHKDDLRPEARGPLKSGAWGGHPICHPQTLAMHASMHTYIHTYRLPRQAKENSSRDKLPEDILLLKHKMRTFLHASQLPKATSKSVP